MKCQALKPQSHTRLGAPDSRQSADIIAERKVLQLRQFRLSREPTAGWVAREGFLKEETSELSSAGRATVD